MSARTWAGRLPGTRAGVMAGLALVAIVSQFFRSSVAVIAPDLIRDLSLSPQMLGLAGGMFFFALGVAQVPVGMGFDRIGPRLTLAWVSVFAIVGSMLVAMAASGPQLIAGRFLVGLGSGASFISGVVLLTRWYPPERIATQYGRVFAFSQIGNFMAATPLAWMSEAFGWRAVFWGAAAVVLAVVIFFVWAVRDQPADQAPLTRRGESLWQTLQGFAQVFGQRNYKKVVAIHTVAYAAMATVLGLWAGPYLHDVHGLDGVGRGNVLLAMAAAQTVGMLWLPPLERRFNTRKGVILAGAGVVVGILVALSALPAPPLWLAVCLLVLLCGASTYSPIIIAHAASLTPVHLRGRGSAAANLGQVTGSFLLPVVSGLIAGLFEQTAMGYPPIAYRLIFGFLALALGTGMLVYSRAQDLKPSAGTA
ncbi:MAG: MFS transporter [Burkholderiaceae bacterium]|nr:MFS transporter [Burkholderiaceae bacterium]